MPAEPTTLDINFKGEYPLRCDGHKESKGTSDHKIWGAKDFLKEVQRRADRYGWDDAKFAAVFTQALQGELADWYEDSYLAGVAEEKNSPLLNTRVSLVRAFRACNFLYDAGRNAELDAIMKQRKGELVGKQYIPRMMRVYKTFRAGVNEDRQKFQRERRTQRLQEEVNEIVQETAADFPDATEQQLTALRRRTMDKFKTIQQAADVDSDDTWVQYVFKTYLPHGMTNERMREEAIKAFDDPRNDNSAKKVVDILEKLEYATVTSAASAKKTVNEIHIDNEDDGSCEGEEEAAAVAAVKNKKKNQAKLDKKRNKKKKAAAATTDEVQAVRQPQGTKKSSRGPCTYCSLENHTAETCFKKLRDLVAKHGDKVNSTIAISPDKPHAHVNTSTVANVKADKHLNFNGFW
jgi:hypothetical protein